MEQLPASYFDTSAWDRREVIAGGSRMIPVSTPSGEFRVWTKRVGNNPDLKVLLLHGGPGASDELYECFDAWFPRAGIEYYSYDQLGSFRSDQPDDPSLWTLERFVDEVEQVRQALGLDRDNFAAHGTPLRPARVPDAAGRLARPGEQGVRPHQPGDLRPDAGAQRARSERHAGGLGPLGRPPAHRRARARHRRHP